MWQVASFAPSSATLMIALPSASPHRFAADCAGPDTATSSMLIANALGSHAIPLTTSRTPTSCRGDSACPLPTFPDLQTACSDVAGPWPHSPIHRLPFWELSPKGVEPAQTKNCLLNCSDSPLFPLFHVQNDPDFPFGN